LNEERGVDVALLEKCRLGEASAFDELILRYQNPVYNLAYRLLGCHDDARTVARDTFVRAYRGMQDFPDGTRVHTWLYSIAGNLARNVMRELNGSRGASETAVEDEDILQEAIEALPEHARTVFVLRTFEGLRYEEIAEAVGCPRGTVNSRMNQARTQLCEALGGRGVV
jgi:RNA polymerase sigma-70 factor (ECF subfamily)